MVSRGQGFEEQGWQEVLVGCQLHNEYKWNHVASQLTVVVNPLKSCSMLFIAIPGKDSLASSLSFKMHGPD